jgi:hypothetical protein
MDVTCQSDGNVESDIDNAVEIINWKSDDDNLKL